MPGREQCSWQREQHEPSSKSLSGVLCRECLLANSQHGSWMGSPSGVPVEAVWGWMALHGGHRKGNAGVRRPVGLRQGSGFLWPCDTTICNHVGDSEGGALAVVQEA